MKNFAVSFFALALSFGIAASAVAEVVPPEFEFYGSARMATFTINTDNGSSDTELMWELAGNSRLGFITKVGDVAGRVELGTGVNVRVLYATYDLGPASLLIGQDYLPNHWFSEQVVDEDLNFIGFGTLYEGRTPQIRLDFDNGFAVALVEPASAPVAEVTTTEDIAVLIDGTPAVITETTTSTGDVDSVLPKLVVSYDTKFGNHAVGAVAGFNTYSQKVGAFDEDINSYLFSLRGKSVFGDADFTWTGHYGQNLANYGITYRREAGASAQVSGSDLEDTDSFGGWVQLGYDARFARFNIGAGYTESDNDLYASADNQGAYFVNAVIPIAKTFFVAPEISYFDLMDATDGSDEGDETWIGAKWQMNF